MTIYLCLEWRDDKGFCEGHWDPIIAYEDENDAKEWMNEKNTKNRDYREIQLVSIKNPEKVINEYTIETKEKDPITNRIMTGVRYTGKSMINDAINEIDNWFDKKGK